MEIIKIDGYLDGGTIAIITTDGEYCIDRRIRTNTKGIIFYGYPKKNNSNIISKQKEIKKELIDAVGKYVANDGDTDWASIIYESLNIK